MQDWGLIIIIHTLELNWPKEDTDAEKQTGQDHAYAQVSCIGVTGLKLEGLSQLTMHFRPSLSGHFLKRV